MGHITGLSLGAGKGSTALSLLLEAEQLPGYIKPDVALFADTQAEPPHVYETLEWLQSRVSWPIIQVSAGDLWTDTWKLINGKTNPLNVNGNGYVDLPVHGSEGGLTPRRCTVDYKVAAIRRGYRQFAEADPPYLQVTQYLGISLDEAHRMKDSRVRYITNVYPLAVLGWRRRDLAAYLDENYPGNPVGRSACFFCPFHSIAEWRDLRRRYPGLYAEALEIDQGLQNMPKGPFSLHRSMGLERAMADADLQGELWPEEPDHFGNECEGLCRV